MEAPERSRLRRDEIGVIYQRENLLPYLNLLENIMLPMRDPDGEQARKLSSKISLANLSAHPAETGILDQQRAALARAMINNPSILLADEPTGELNTKETGNLVDTIRELSRTCIMTSNNKELQDYSDNIYHLYDGVLRND